MELGDAPLMRSWARIATDLFKGELTELEQLYSAVKSDDAAAAMSMREQATRDVDAALARQSASSGGLSSTLPGPKAPGVRGDTAGGGGSAAGAKKQQQQQQQQRLKAAAQAMAAEQKARRAAERASMIEEQIQRMREARDRQPWRQLMHAYAAHVSETERTLEPVRVKERREYDYFMTKPLEAFTMDEIVGTREPCSPQEPVPTAVAGPSGDAKSQEWGEAASHLTSAPPRDFVIDARAFAEAYDSFLREEYNYKPVFTTRDAAGAAGNGAEAASASPLPMSSRRREEEMRTAPGNAKHGVTIIRSAAAGACESDAGTNGADEAVFAAAAPLHGLSKGVEDARAALVQKLMTHRPGLDTLPPTFCVDGEAERTMASSLPPLPTRTTGGAAANGATHDVPNPLTSSVPTLPRLDGAYAKKIKKASADTKVKTNTAATSEALLKGITCSVRSRHVTLRTHTGTIATATVRFTNRNANPTKLRLRPSSHPWLQYRCVRLAAVAGATDRLAENANTSVEPAPLSCGGYMEVELSFNPEDMSQPSLNEVLQIGVTRELNARNAEGAQWSFYDVSVACETVLPAFRFTRRERQTSSPSRSSLTTAEGMATSSVRVDTTGTAAASPQTAFGADDAEGFPPTFVCERKTQSYRLENTGSDCVVNIISSSPCFRVRPSPESTTLLPRGTGMGVAVTFAPLREGPCDGTLTIVVRGASGEDPVLSEHTFDLHGFGVVPRVCIARVGDVALALNSTTPGDDRGEVDRTVAELLARAVTKYMVQGTSPEVPVTVPVTVRNESPVPLPYYWDVEAVAGGAGDASSLDSTPPVLAVEPAVGVLPGGSAETEFAVRLTPRSASPILASLNLFLVGLPDPAAATRKRRASDEGNDEGEGAVEDMEDDSEDLLQPQGAIVELLRKDKQLPSALAAVGALTFRSNSNNSSIGDASDARSMIDALTASMINSGHRQALTDPYAVFLPSFQRPQGESPSASNRGATFIAGLILFSRPVLATVEVVPPVLEEAVECLAGLPYVRQITLHNPSPCPIHYIWNPTLAELGGDRAFAAAATATMAEEGNLLTPIAARRRDGGGTYSDDPEDDSVEREIGAGAAGKVHVPSTITAAAAATAVYSSDVDIRCFPGKGAIPPGGSVAVQVHFTVSRPGQHVGMVPLYVPELDRGLRIPGERGGMESANAGRAGPRRSLVNFTVLVRGIGPSVHVNTELLDFGFIEFGNEAEASFTVTNDNPVPVAFDLQDPLMREPPRFVFIPPAFRLAPGDSVEVTVYRKAVSVEDAQTYFELVVRDGGTIAMETRATIQKPTMLLDEATVNFGTVPEGVWQERYFYLTNLSAVDMPFTVELAATAPNLCVELDLPVGPQHLRAGHKHCPVLVRARFTAASAPRAMASSATADGGGSAASSAHHVLLGIRSKRKRRTETGSAGNGQVLLLELYCEAVERLALSVDLLAASASATTNSHSNAMTAAVAIANQVSPLVAPPMPAEAYLCAFLWNLVEHSVLAAVEAASGAVSSKLPRTSAIATTAITSSPTTNAAALTTARFQPYCAPVTLRSLLADDAPVGVQTLAVRIVNYSRCVSSCTATALHFAPLPIVTSLEGWRQQARQGSDRSTRSAASTTAALAAGRHRSGRSAGLHGTRDAVVHTVSGDAVGPKAMLSMNSHFWTTANNGVEVVKRRERAALAGAEALLLDGRCCVTVLGDSDSHTPRPTTNGITTTGNGFISDCPAATSAEIGPLQTVELPVTLMANLPGCYQETVRVACAGLLAPVELPVTWEVRGRPVLLDPTTSGLTTTSEGHAVLVMPPTVASLGSSRRTLRVLNRSPRDLDVAVEMLVSGSTFAVTAVDDDVPASEVVLTLGPIPESQRAADRRRFGNAVASPSNFFLPAMSTKEVHLTYTPDVQVVQPLLGSIAGSHRGENSARGGNGKDVHGSRQSHDRVEEGANCGEVDDDDGDDDRTRGAMSQEVDWQGSLVIQAELARSAFNDTFLMDEFYELYRSRFPSTRSLTILHDSAATSSGGGGVASAKSQRHSKSDGHEGWGRGNFGRANAPLSWTHAADGPSSTGMRGVNGATAAGVTAARAGPMLKVMRPLITRPGMVVRYSKLVKPVPAEVLLVEYAQQRAAGRVLSASPTGGVGAGAQGLSTGNGERSATLGRSDATAHGQQHALAALGHLAGRGADGEDDDDSSSSNASDSDGSGAFTVGGGGGMHRTSTKGKRGAGGVHNSPALQAAAQNGALRPLSTLLEEAQERALLTDYLASRYAALREESRRTFLPIELRLRARCGVPLMAVQPSERLVTFPAVRAQGLGLASRGRNAEAVALCKRTLRLTNHNSAALYFTVSVGPVTIGAGVRWGGNATDAAGAFSVMTTELVPQLVSPTILVEDDEEGRQAGRNRCKPSKAKCIIDSRTGKGVTGATGVIATTSTAATSASWHTKETGVVAVPMTAAIADAVTNPSSTERAIYCLDGHRSLDVTVAYTPPGENVSRNSLTVESGSQHPALWSTFTIQFFANCAGSANGSSVVEGMADTLSNTGLSTAAVATASRKGAPTSPAPAHDLIPGPTQSIRLRVPLSTARVSCQPTLLWFKPSQLVHDGRPQPSYTQRLRLFNQGSSPVSFELVSRPQGGTAESSRGQMPSQATAVAATRTFKVTEIMRMPVSPDGGVGVLAAGVTPAQGPFTIEPTRGTIPAATAGGEPGSVEVDVRFTEFSNVRFEREFAVAVDGELTETAFVLRGDSRETEL